MYHGKEKYYTGALLYVTLGSHWGFLVGHFKVRVLRFI